MILPAQEIRRRALAAKLISPFSERTTTDGLSYGLSPAGYDIRAAEELRVFDGELRLTYSLEHFNMSLDLLAYVKDKSSWARRGLFVQNTVIEPGWRGYLTLELTFHGDGFILIHKGAPIAQIIFHLLSSPTEQPYSGKYQDQPARPVGAKYES